MNERDRVLTSRRHPLVRLALRLHTKRGRDEEGLFLIEGTVELKRACTTGIKINELLMTPEVSRSSRAAPLIDYVSSGGGGCSICDRQIMDRICYRSQAQSVLAIAPTFKTEMDCLKIDRSSIFVVCVGIEKPGNLGSIIRSADAAGIDGIIVCDAATDLFNPNVVRSSIGTLFSLPVVNVSQTEFLDWRHEAGIQIVATAPSSHKPYYEVDFTQSVAIIVGNESVGLNDDWLRSADEIVALPQLGQSDSVNVAMTATVLSFEARRQRDLSGRSNQN